MMWRNPRSFFKSVVLSSVCGVLSGLAATVFLYLLAMATNFREQNSWIIWFLPIAGFALGWVYHHYGQDVVQGNQLIFEEMHDPKKVIPFKMSPFILLGTLVTHLFGGSAGREGTAVQMAASLSDQLSRVFNVSSEERRILLMAGAGAGFGAAIGTPWAGAIFGMEVVSAGRPRWRVFIECLVASFVAFAVAKILRAPHSLYPTPSFISFSWNALFFVAIAGVAFGVAARVFVKGVHQIEKWQSRFISYAPWKPALAGLILVAFYYLEGSYRYVGLGISEINYAISQGSSFDEPLLKGIFTAATIGSGFKGGEFIPLVFIGATLGSALSVILPVAFDLLAVVGFAAVFAGASQTPIACSVMAIELFGWTVSPYALVGCLISYFIVGSEGIYKSASRLSAT